ncbi:PEP/pyruvate-binding domain-containing protein [Marinospirillum sp.]|uniref:PEP/pyruvate-binding domain-containing protein n=1 Tax=Marinospirillum sp. TaxID=2183934 RepID=UPI003A847482
MFSRVEKAVAQSKALPWLVDQHQDVQLDQLGGKAYALACLQQAGFTVPAWCVVTPEACPLEPTERNEASLAQLVFPADQAQDLTAYLAARFPADALFAVRSSALDEDGQQHSFAGQLDSFLQVPLDQVAERIVAVWCSGFSESLLHYRQTAGLTTPPPLPSVLIQPMLDAQAAGVAFSADPISGRRDVCWIAAVEGLAEALVAGEVSGWSWTVSAQETVELIEPIEGSLPPLSEEQLVQVARLARQASLYFERPQDMEWVWSEQQGLVLVQSRPITTLARRVDPRGRSLLWDNSNIAESYGGITTPLTFSFARMAYTSVYREFCKILGVRRAKIEQEETTFTQMLGLIRGRVFYNLISWYRVLALLPGFRFNQRFMEQMMGVKEPLPAHLLEPTSAPSRAARWLDLLHLLGTGLGLIKQHLLLPRSIRCFHQRVQQALNTHASLEQLEATQLVAHYHQLKEHLLTRWDAPLVNDFFAMIFYGLLRQLLTRWSGDQGQGLHNDLLAGEGGMISAEPVQRMRQLATLALAEPQLLQCLQEGDPAKLKLILADYPAFSLAWHDYLDQFGDRCLDELKLESATLHDDPRLLMQGVAALASMPPSDAATEQLQKNRQQTEQSLAALLKPGWRYWIYAWVLRHARARVRDRENLRFERTRVFGRVRRIFVELGRRFYAEGHLQHPRDIFYLEVDEVLGFVQGTATTWNLKGLVALRQAEYAAYAEQEAPDDRFTTQGSVAACQSYLNTEKLDELHGELQGIGCCPGRVRGRVRIVRDPREAELAPGDILVAERTDPGWVMLFPCAAGLLVERGSLLSHSAIVARELGLPAIVSIPGVMRLLQEGEEIEFDGATGRILRFTASVEAEHAE